MADETSRSAVDDLLDGFVDGLIPPHHQIAAVPYATIEVRKEDLREAGRLLLGRYAEYLNAGAAAPAAAETSAPHSP
jgi:hypothetical protein